MKFSDEKSGLWRWLLLVASLQMLSACSGFGGRPQQELPALPDEGSYQYLIGPGDSLNVFVWRNPDVSSSVSVRPDGKISTPLVEDLIAVGKTPSALAREIEAVLGQYIKDPLVTVSVNTFVGEYAEQIRVVGEAVTPLALPYRENMTLLDVMIEVGGLTEFASGNNSTLVRTINGTQYQTGVRLDDLIKHGDIGANIKMQPGDVLIVPESWF